MFCPKIVVKQIEEKRKWKIFSETLDLNFRLKRRGNLWWKKENSAYRSLAVRQNLLNFVNHRFFRVAAAHLKKLKNVGGKSAGQTSKGVGGNAGHVTQGC